MGSVRSVLFWDSSWRGNVLMDSRHEEMKAQVNDFHQQHPEVWRLFCGFAFEMIHRGYLHYSVNAVFERIRWEIDAGGDGTDAFKLNNNYRAFYARRFRNLYPEHAEFFRIRIQTSKDKSATNLPELRPKHYEYEEDDADYRRGRDRSSYKFT